MNAKLSPPPRREALRVAAFPREPRGCAAPSKLSGRHVLRSAARARDLMERVGAYTRKLPGRRTSYVERAYALHYAARDLCTSQGMRVHVSGGVIPERCVLVANHLSYIDPLAIARLGPTLAIAKAEVEAWPGIGPILQRLGVLFVKRDDPHSGARVMKSALRALSQGARVLTFPEGTTSDGTQLLPFRLGAFAIARLANVPVVPIAVRLAPELCWHGDAAFLPHYLRSVAQPALHIELEVGRALSPHRTLSDQSLADFIRADLSHMLAPSPSQKEQHAACCDLCSTGATHVEPLLAHALAGLGA